MRAERDAQRLHIVEWRVPVVHLSRYVGFIGSMHDGSCEFVCGVKARRDDWYIATPDAVATCIGCIAEEGAAS